MELKAWYGDLSKIISGIETFLRFISVNFKSALLVYGAIRFPLLSAIHPLQDQKNRGKNQAESPSWR